jgi:hypothetical protein
MSSPESAPPAIAFRSDETEQFLAGIRRKLKALPELQEILNKVSQKLKKTTNDVKAEALLGQKKYVEDHMGLLLLLGKNDEAERLRRSNTVPIATAMPDGTRLVGHTR